MNFIYFMNNILDEFADDVTVIIIRHKQIEGLLDFKRFTKLTKLNCCYNKITSLDNLPNSLTILYCGNNQITSLENLVPKGTEAFSSKKTFQIH